MLRLLAANPELQASIIPQAASLAYVSSDDVDGAGAPRWGGYQHGELSCEQLDEVGLPCDDADDGFAWGGIAIALVIAFLALAAAGAVCWWVRRRNGAMTTNGHEIKSQQAENSMDEMLVDRNIEDAKLAESELEMGKVQVDPYEPDGYDPNNVSKILGELTTGEQVIKAKVRLARPPGPLPRSCQVTRLRWRRPRPR